MGAAFAPHSCGMALPVFRCLISAWPKIWMLTLAWNGFGSLESFLLYASFDSRVELQVVGSYVFGPLILDCLVWQSSFPPSCGGRAVAEATRGLLCSAIFTPLERLIAFAPFSQRLLHLKLGKVLQLIILLLPPVC